MPININVKGDGKPIQLTLTQSTMFIHVGLTPDQPMPLMVTDTGEDGAVEDRVQDPKFATHDWGTINVELQASPDPPKVGEKAKPKPDDDESNSDYRYSDSEGKESDKEGAAPERTGRDRDTHSTPMAPMAAGGGGSGGRGSAGNSIHGGDDARLGLPDMINPFGPLAPPLKTVAHRYGRCECGRICDWRFRLVDHHLHSGYEESDKPDSDDDDTKMISDGEEVTRSARRKRLGCQNDVILLEKRQR